MQVLLIDSKNQDRPGDRRPSGVGGGIVPFVEQLEPGSTLAAVGPLAGAIGVIQNCS